MLEHPESTARERQYTATGEDVQVPYAVCIHLWGKTGQGIDTRIVKANPVLRGVSFHSLLTKQEIQTSKNRQFYIEFCSDPQLRSSILGNDWKNTIQRATRRDGSFAKRSRCDTSRQSAQLWNSQSPEFRGPC